MQKNVGSCELHKNFKNSLTTVKVMTKTKVAPFYLGHGVHSTCAPSCQPACRGRSIRLPTSPKRLRNSCELVGN